MNNTAPTFTVSDANVITDFGSASAGSNDVGGVSGSAFALARYNTDGTLDTSFDTDGKLTTDIAAGSYGQGNGVVVQADGKLLVAGSSNGDLAMVRYNADGSLDTSFDLDGKVTLAFSGDVAHAVALQADGKILVAGYSGLSVALARYNTDGSLDTSFDADGKLTTSFEGSASGQSVALQADGKILVAGWAFIAGNTNFAVLRYNVDGSVDTTFDADGKAFADFDSADAAYSMVVQADGKIVLAGTSNADFAVARFNADGSLDTTFSAPQNTFDTTPTYVEPTLPGLMNAVLLDAHAQIADAELAKANSYAGASLTLARHGGANAEDVFAARAGGSLSILLDGSYFSVGGVTVGQVTANTAGSLTLTFTADATESLVNQAMQQITYANRSDAPPATAQID